MANTIDAIVLSGLDWENLNILSGIAVGSAITIQNQTNQNVFIAISSVKPVSSFKGFAIPPKLESLANVPSGENIVWVFGNGPISVQVD